MLLSACAENPPIIPAPLPLPSELASCPDAPPKPSGDYQQTAVAKYITDLFYAWKNCHEKLAEVSALQK